MCIQLLPHAACAAHTPSPCKKHDWEDLSESGCTQDMSARSAKMKHLARQNKTTAIEDKTKPIYADPEG